MSASELRAQLIDMAHGFVTGAPVSAADFAKGDAAVMAGKATYASMVLELKGKMKGDRR